MTTVLLHGLGGDARQPLSLLGPVLPADTLAPDARAHGSSTLIGHPADFNLAALAAELPLPAGPLTVIGVSMGAALALRIALTRPVERLILLRPSFTTQPLPAHLRVFPVIGELLAHHGAERGEELFRHSNLFHALEAESELGAQGMIDQFRKPDAAARAIRLVEIPRNRAYRAASELAGLSMPASVIAAPRDPVHPLAVAEQWTADLPNARLTALPARDAGLRAYTDATRTAVAEALSG
jgi:pimeloyl-ACP methyl ester carboxylesterase